MFAGQRGGLSFHMREGQQIIVLGSVNVYERTGSYQLYANEIRLDGEGALYEKYQMLKQELEEMGMFAPEYKQEIPAYAKRIGVVTAPTGAAIRDIMNISARRNPYVQLLLYPAQVQGEGAKESIVRGIRMLETKNVDVIIVGRGGGSIEDLWAFNEEIVARAIYDCKIPVVSGVGHEPDFTIADFVADYRSPTPTGAAKDVTPITKDDLLLSLSKDKKRIYNAIKNLLSKERIRLDRYKNSYVIKNPMRMYETKMQRLDFLIDKLHSLNPSVLCEKEFVRLNNLSEKINRIMQNKLDTTRLQYKSLIEKLELVNPLSTLKRGYSITYKDGKALTDIKNIKAKDSLTIRLYNGEASVVVTNIKEM